MFDSSSTTRPLPALAPFGSAFIVTSSRKFLWKSWESDGRAPGGGVLGDRGASCKDWRWVRWPAPGRPSRPAVAPPRAAPERRPPRRRAGDAARALLRPRLRPRDHRVHLADVPPPDLDRAGPGAAGARRALVGLGELRLADQRDRPRGGPGPARLLRRDGLDADRGDLRARGVRQPGARLRPLDRLLPRRPHRALHDRRLARAEPGPLGARADRLDRGRG